MSRRDDYISGINPIRQQVMGKRISGYFGLQFQPSSHDDSGFVKQVSVSLRTEANNNAGTLVIDHTTSGLEVSYKP